MDPLTARVAVTNEPWKEAGSYRCVRWIVRKRLAQDAFLVVGAHDFTGDADGGKRDGGDSEPRESDEHVNGDVAGVERMTNQRVGTTAH
jgi:hypothetical protein